MNTDSPTLGKVTKYLGSKGIQGTNSLSVSLLSIPVILTFIVPDFVESKIETTSPILMIGITLLFVLF